MIITRRVALSGLLAAPAILSGGAARAETRTLKISHQFPGGTIDEGDFRDRLVRRFAAAVTERTKGAITFDIYPGSSLMKTVAQFSALRHGALDFTLYPLAYAGGEVPEVNIGLMPALTTSYEQGYAWKNADIGRELTSILDAHGVKIITWIWQAGGLASRASAVLLPEDAKGLKIRGGSREMDQMMAAAGAITSSVPSNEIYAAMQTGTMDAALTSSTSLISFRLQEVSKHVTTGRRGSYWFMLEPLLMAKSAFDSLAPDQQAAITEVGASEESFALEQARADDEALATIYGKAGVGVHDMTADDLAKWRTIAADTAWKNFASRGPAFAALLAMAEKTG